MYFETFPLYFKIIFFVGFSQAYPQEKPKSFKMSWKLSMKLPRSSLLTLILINIFHFQVRRALLIMHQRDEVEYKRERRIVIRKAWSLQCFQSWWDSKNTNDWKIWKVCKCTTIWKWSLMILLLAWLPTNTVFPLC